jgi:hypothetical protein
VRAAVERLRAEGRRIGLVEVARTPFAEALAIYRSADVYCGKLLMGYYNNAVIECLAMGVPCMCWMRPEYMKDIPDCPVIVTRPETVEANLRRAMDEREWLRTAGERGPGFVANHHAPGVVLERLRALYDKAAQEEGG